MDFKDKVLAIVQMFVPEQYQVTSNSFFNYLKALPEKRTHIRLYSMCISFREGVQIIEYLQGSTAVHELSWISVKKLLEKEYLTKYPASPQYQMHLDQLQNSF